MSVGADASAAAIVDAIRTRRTSAREVVTGALEADRPGATGCSTASHESSASGHRRRWTGSTASSRPGGDPGPLRRRPVRRQEPLRRRRRHDPRRLAHPRASIRRRSATRGGGGLAPPRGRRPGRMPQHGRVRASASRRRTRTTGRPATRTISRGSPAARRAARPRRSRRAWCRWRSAPDTNGSIRVPAALCGVFGPKPTYGRAVSAPASFLFAGSLDHVGLLRSLGPRPRRRIRRGPGPGRRRSRSAPIAPPSPRLPGSISGSTASESRSPAATSRSSPSPPRWPPSSAWPARFGAKPPRHRSRCSAGARRRVGDHVHRGRLLPSRRLPQASARRTSIR